MLITKPIEGGDADQRDVPIFAVSVKKIKAGRR
jgi:hypothetical protein